MVILEQEDITNNWGIYSGWFLFEVFQFPKPEPAEEKITYTEYREINDNYLCELGACNKELVDGVPPCADCKFCVSKEDAYLDF